MRWAVASLCGAVAAAVVWAAVRIVHAAEGALTAAVADLSSTVR